MRRTVNAVHLPQGKVSGEPEHVRHLLGLIRPALTGMPTIRAVEFLITEGELALEDVPDPRHRSEGT